MAGAQELNDFRGLRWLTIPNAPTRRQRLTGEVSRLRNLAQ